MLDSDKSGAPPQAFASALSASIDHHEIGRLQHCRRSAPAPSQLADSRECDMQVGMPRRFCNLERGPAGLDEGRERAIVRMCANRPARMSGTAEARIPKRNMIRHSLNTPVNSGLMVAECKED